MAYRWTLLIDQYTGLHKKAVNTLSGVISGYLEYVLPVAAYSLTEEETLQQHNLIVLGTSENRHIQQYQSQNLIHVPQQAESYAIYVGENIHNKDAQMILIAGYDALGLLYGCMEFCNRYCGNQLYQESYLWTKSLFDRPFDRHLPPWTVSRTPAIPTRALWTWGHVIYDYRSFFENMAKLRLNEVVIWNDHVPLNADDVVAYAHSLGIKVIWGFAWGWTSRCADFIQNFDLETLPRLKESILQTYETQYAQTGGDGIYFQSFTEASTDTIGGKTIAQIVTELVNDVAGTLLERHPGLHIQFGLHATSVNTHLQTLRAVDPRVHIVWEDCGAFPYSYNTGVTENFPETLDVTRHLLTLRGEKEAFGAVLKGMMNLDWPCFEHFSQSYIMGEHTKDYIQKRQAQKNGVWKIVQAGWLKNASYAQKMIQLIANIGDRPIVEALVEDAMFENEIMFPVALYAELLWTPDADLGSLFEEVAKYPCVRLANP